jgi:hypothetical protein
MEDTLLNTFNIMLKSLALTFLGMIIFYCLIKVLVRLFPDKKSTNNPLNF